MSPRSVLLALSIALVAAPAAAQPIADADSSTQSKPAASQPKPPAKPQPQPKPEKPDDGVRFEFKRPPSLRVGDDFRMDFRVKVHADHRTFWPDLRREDNLDLRRVRAAVEGEIKNVVQYEVEYDFREQDDPLRDAFVDVRVHPRLEVRGGKFKMPFSREALIGVTSLPFAFRSRAADQLAPGRAIGVMAHGRAFDRRLDYSIGLFREDGENARRDPARVEEAASESGTGGVESLLRSATWAARATLRRAGDAEGLEAGASFTRGSIPEGRNGLRGRMVFGGGFFSALEVNGTRQRIGADAAFESDRYSIAGELIRVTDQRLGQGFDDEDLGAAVMYGWSIAGTWIAAGRKPGNADRPANRFGAVELTARLEQLRFTGPSEGDEPSRSPRASVILPNGDRVWTFGANWYVHSLVRVQGNLIRETLEDAMRAPVPGRQNYWGAIVRFQFAL